MLRAHGWWHAQADRLAAEQLGWGGRRGVLLLSSASVLRAPTGGRATISTAEAASLIGNLLLLAALLGRVAVVPELLCDAMEATPGIPPWKETRRRQGQRRCA